MNQDEDNRKPDLHAAIDPELEARVVAWVAGEASAFEIAEMERLIREKPELGIFKRRIEAVQDLVAEALRADAQPLRLSDERRAKLLSAMGAANAVSPPTPVNGAKEKPVKPVTRQRIWLNPIWGIGLAACIALGVFLLPVSDHDEPVRLELARTEPNFKKRIGAQVIGTPREVELQMPAPISIAVQSMDAPTRAEPIVKLDAFTVSESREAGYAAAMSAPNFGQPLSAAGKSLIDKSTLTLGDAPTVAMTDGAVIGGAGGGGVHNRIFQEGAGVSGTVVSQGAAVAADAVAANALDIDGAKRAPASKAVAFKGGRDAVVPPSVPWSAPAGFGDRATELSQSKPFMFSTPLGMSAVGGTFDANAAPASPPENEPVQLSAFVVAGPKQKDAETSPLRQSTGAEQTAAAVAVAKASADDATLTARLNETLAVNDDRQLSEAERNDAKVKLEAARARLKKLQEERTRMLEERKSRDNPPATSPAQPANQETSAAQESVSTFSLHVSDVSFRLAVAAMAARERGENPPLPEIRAEEFYNAFNYGDPAPAMAEKIAARIEQSAHPYLQQRNLLRIAMKVPATGRSAGQPLRLTVLLDTSGSMEREDRRMSVRRALEELIGLLGANDRVTLIGFARQPRLLAESVVGNQAGHLVELSARTPAEGGTNLEEALKLAGELAIRHRQNGAQNRIVLLTDGAANLGDADPAQLATRIDALRQQGIAFDACGIGLEGIGDAVLEALTRQGDGRYYVIDRPEAADAAFARQLAGAFRPAAENVKLQVRFNPARVGRYRLIGFDSHRLRTEDFRNDKVDAAELAAGEGATALYQIEVLPQGTGEVGEVFVRFRDAASGAMVERSWTIAYEPAAPRFDRAMPSLQVAGLAALTAEKLGAASQPSPFKLGDFAGVANAVRGHYASEPRVQDLVTLYGRLRRMTGE